MTGMQIQAFAGESLQIKSVEDLLKVAQVLLKSGLLPKSINTAEKAAVVILKGRELGLKMMESFNLIVPIANKPTLVPQGMLAVIRRDGLLEEIKIQDDGEKCTVTMKRRGGETQTASFSMEQAKKLKTVEWEDNVKKTISLSEKSNWIQQPKVMRQWRAVAACCRILFPDSIGGLYTPEEMGAIVNEEGEVIDAEVIERPQTAEPKTSVSADDSPTEQPSPPTEPEPQVWSPPEGSPLEYDREGNVKWGTTFYPRNDKVAISDKVVSAITALFDNEFAMRNHLKKRFQVGALRSLTWEQLAALVACKKNKVYDPRWYADKLQGTITSEAASLGADVIAVDPNTQVAMQQYGIEDFGSEKDLVAALMAMPDVLCLAYLHWYPARKEELHSLATLVGNGSMKVGDDAFKSLVGASDEIPF